jgi:hypothetical protein
MTHTRWRIRIKWLAGIVLILALTLLASGSTFTQAPAPQYPLGDIPLDRTTYQMHLRAFPDAAIEALSSDYDARDFGLVTSAKDQGSCGSCWAFASVGAMESHLLKQYGFGPTDLSEQQQVSCNTSMLGCRGGNSDAIAYWETKGPLDEECFPYTASDRTPCAEDHCTQYPYRVENYHTVPATPDQFKSSLYIYGPSYWRFTVHSDFFTYWNDGSEGQVYVNNSYSYEGGHAVLLIGWDDAKGAYLCKNSWGETGGPNGDGTFWIAYTGHANNLSFGMANFALESSIACYTNADCDDGEPCTTDTCTNPDQPGASCENTWPACGADDGCCGPGCTYPDPDCPPCGDGTCAGAANGEDCNTCPADCPSGTGGGTCEACFKGVCDGVCHPVKEGSECTDCAPSFCCGDGTCEPDEDGDNCPVDCGALECGDGTCDPGETPCNCALDCGWPPENEVGLCGNSIDDDCDGNTDCDDGDCTVDPACDCLQKGESCSDGNECCSGTCLPSNKCK